LENLEMSMEGVDVEAPIALWKEGRKGRSKEKRKLMHEEM
jgi:hypothetical protein